jgi:beta-mannosidase
VPFVPDKHLALTDPGLALDVHQQGDHVVLSLTARSLARFVQLALEGVDVVFSDSYFDLPAGRQVVVTCPLPQGWDLQQAREALVIRSLYDSYA